jgi:hypothetical protein
MPAQYLFRSHGNLVRREGVCESKYPSNRPTNLGLKRDGSGQWFAGSIADDYYLLYLHRKKIRWRNHIGSNDSDCGHRWSTSRWHH